MKPKPWTNDEDKYLNDNYADTSSHELAEELNRTVSSVRNRSVLLFLRKNKKMYAYYKGDEHIITGTISEVADYVGVKKKTIGFYCSQSHRKRFENSNNPENAVMVTRFYDVN